MIRAPLPRLLEHHYVTLILDALHQAGVLAALEVPLHPSEVARRCGLDEALLAPLLTLACARSDLLDVLHDGRVVRTGGDAALDMTRHLLDQYVGGFGPTLGSLAVMLKGDGGRPAFDEQRHAAAFLGNDPFDSPLQEVARLILALGATGVVELGCGGAQTLCQLAARSPGLRGLGIDANPWMIGQAQRTVDRLGFRSRVELVCGDAIAVVRARGPAAMSNVQVVLASSFLNAFWRRASDLPDLIRALGALAPGRILIVSDYYGGLGQSEIDALAPRTLVHDIAQLASGQGVPGSSRILWSDAYAAGGATLLECHEACFDGIDRFIHVVELGESADAQFGPDLSGELRDGP
ncbi:class I SAM-dependent methyltransferase [Sphingomonas qilianensis]|uniref:Class I SAM-dependent methyltransferase n=1 Tax=Sphingomonas qilianensis TaxID=1736690 RepID=A0ABU9XVI7_9SPHN